MMAITYALACAHNTEAIQQAPFVLTSDPITILGIEHGMFIPPDDLGNFLTDKQKIVIEDDSGRFERYPEGSIERGLLSASSGRGIPFAHIGYRRDEKDVSCYVKQHGLELKLFGFFAAMNLTAHMIMDGYTPDERTMQDCLTKRYQTIDHSRSTQAALRMVYGVNRTEYEFILEAVCAPVLQFVTLLTEHYFLIPNARDEIQGKTLLVCGANHAQRLYAALAEGTEIEAPIWSEFMAGEKERLALIQRVLSFAYQ